MERFPVELIEKILCGLTVRDLVNFSSTCKYFRYLIPEMGIIWKCLLRTRYYRCLEDIDFYQLTYYEMMRFVYSIKHKTREMLDEMAHTFCDKEEVNPTDLGPWDSFLHSAYHIIKEDLRDIIHTKCEAETMNAIPLSTPGHLTRKYYAHIVLRYVQQIEIQKKEWKRYNSRSSQRRVLEKGVILMAQWRQPTVEINENIRDKLDDIANMVKYQLRKDHPNHPVFEMASMDIDYCKRKRLTRNVWSMNHCRLILCAINKVLYEDLKLSCPSPARAWVGPMERDYLINIVLDTKVGSPELLTVIYEAVARRLNVHCTSMIISDPYTCLIRVSYCISLTYKPKFGGFFVYTSVGRIVDEASVKNDLGVRSPFEDLTVLDEDMIDIIGRNIYNSVCQSYHPQSRTTELRSVYDLKRLVRRYVPISEPNDLDTIYAVQNRIIIRYINTEWLEELRRSHHPRRKAVEVQSVCELSCVKACNGKRLMRTPGAHEDESDDEFEKYKETEDMYPEQSPRRAKLRYRLHYPERIIHPRKRLIRIPSERNHVHYAVGMVVYHKTSGYKGVIFKWDVICRAEVNWALNHNATVNEDKTSQPYYSLLLEDKSFRYAPQDEMVAIHDSLDSDLETELGKFFSHYYKSYYVPNQWIEKYYPTDGIVRDHYLAHFEAHADSED